MALSTEVIYDTYGNNVKLQLQVDGTALADHRNITRAILEFGKGNTQISPDPYLTIDSSTDPDYFDFTEVSRMTLLLGDAGLPKGRHIVSLTVFITSTYPDGLSYGPAIDLRVR